MIIIISIELYIIEIKNYMYDWIPKYDQDENQMDLPDDLLMHLAMS